MAKAREFSIFDNLYFREAHNSYQCIELANGVPLDHSDFHVIEKQAYNDLKNQADALANCVKGFTQLLDDEVLVRNIDDDHDKNKYMEQATRIMAHLASVNSSLQSYESFKKGMSDDR